MQDYPEGGTPTSCSLIVVVQSPFLYRAIGRNGEVIFPRGPTIRSLPIVRTRRHRRQCPRIWERRIWLRYFFRHVSNDLANLIVDAVVCLSQINWDKFLNIVLDEAQAGTFEQMPDEFGKIFNRTNLELNLGQTSITFRKTQIQIFVVLEQISDTFRQFPLYEKFKFLHPLV